MAADADADAAAALNALGERHERGEGVAVDARMAADYFRAAGARGSAVARFNLAGLYFLGEGATQDDAEALRLYASAAEGGHVESAFLVGRMYHNGRGAPANVDEALRWYERAAAKGHEDAAASVRRLVGPLDHSRLGPYILPIIASFAAIIALAGYGILWLLRLGVAL